MELAQEPPQCNMETKKDFSKPYGRLEGIILKVISIGFSVLMQIITKNLYVKTSITPMEVAYWRGVFVVLFGISYAQYQSIDIIAVPKKQYSPMWYRSVINAVNNMLFFITTKLFPLSLNTAISYLSPMMTAGMSYVFLHEMLTGYDVGTMAIAFSGVAIIVFNPYKASDLGNIYDINWYYYIIPLLKPIFGSTSTILMRYMGTSIHCVMAPTFLGIVIGIFAPLFMFSFLSIRELFTQYDWFIAIHLLGIGLTGAIAQILTSRSLQIEKAGRVQAFNYTKIVFTMSADVFLFGIPIHWLDLIGIAIILSSNILLATMKAFGVIK